MELPDAGGVPVAPNECQIRGSIREVEPAPGGVGSVWNIDVDDSIDIAGLRNLARKHIGKRIALLVHPDLKKRFKAGESIVARVLFQGDEHGGAFFLKGDEVERQPEP